MASYVAPGSNAYNDQLKQQADQYGISTEQMAALLAANPPVYNQNNQGGQYGMSAGGSYGQNPNLTSTLSALGAMKQAAGNQQQQAPASTSSSGGPFTDAENLAGRMGAAALGTNQIINPTPGQIPQGGLGKGGVAQVASPITSSDVPSAPTGPWSSVGSVFGPGTNAAANNPAPASGGTPTPTKPANAPGGAVATPWATAPPAPGASVQPQGSTGWGAIADQQAREDAGKAIYAHFGGDPSKATPEDINHFNTQLQFHIGQAASAFGAQTGGTPFGQAPPGAANYTAGVQPGISATGATPGGALGVTPPPSAPGAPPKMATGGFVPGRGNGDTVPALLTPGEYVIPKAQAAQMFGGRAPIRMADGGFVPDQDKKPSPESRHAALVEAAQGAPQKGMTPPPTSSSGSGQSSGGSSSSGDSNQPSWMKYLQEAQQMKANAANTMAQNAQTGANTANASGATTPAAQGYAADANAGLVGGSAPSAATVADAASMTPAATQASVMAAQNPGAQQMAAAGAISDLANGLNKAMKSYTDSIKPWQMLSQQFGQGGTPSYQTTQLQQDQDV